MTEFKFLVNYPFKLILFVGQYDGFRRSVHEIESVCANREINSKMQLLNAVCVTIH